MVDISLDFLEKFKKDMLKFKKEMEEELFKLVPLPNRTYQTNNNIQYNQEDVSTNATPHQTSMVNTGVNENDMSEYVTQSNEENYKEPSRTLKYYYADKVINLAKRYAEIGTDSNEALQKAFEEVAQEIIKKGYPPSFIEEVKEEVINKLS